MHAPDSTPIEDSRDAIALQVAEISAGQTSEVGESSAPVRVEYSEKNLTRYEDPIDDEKLLTVEEFLEISTRDTPSVRAFKFLVNELLSRMNQSKPSACRMRHTSGFSIPDSLPSVSDFCADISLCVKNSCSQALYQIFCKCVDSQFELWPRVPESVRNALMERAGKMMVKRALIRNGKTRHYWDEGYLKYGPRTKDTRNVRVA